MSFDLTREGHQLLNYFIFGFSIWNSGLVLDHKKMLVLLVTLIMLTQERKVRPKAKYLDITIQNVRKIYNYSNKIY